MTADTIYLVEVTWPDGTAQRVLVDREQLGDISFAEWRDNLVARANTRPQWASLGDLSFHTQGVRSIELIETIEKED